MCKEEEVVQLIIRNATTNDAAQLTTLLQRERGIYQLKINSK